MKALRVVVGLSGGVDSTVSAFLLKQKGYEVHGVYMVNWDQLEEGTSNCPRTLEEADARKVCDRFNIPFHTINFVKEYWNQVFVGMLENYKKGRTVVPDIQCNKFIKFDCFHKYAIENLGADFVATGHYATIQGNTENASMKARLFCSKDPIKDQTYFLSTLSQNQLQRAMFPVGSMYKSEVIEIAKQIGCKDISEKPESMGICFIGKKKRFDDFMNEYIEPISGDIVTESGKVVGQHKGVHHFTLGKRVPIRNGSHLGLFVSRIDSKNNLVHVVEGSHHPLLYATHFLIQRPKWIADDPLEKKLSISCRIQRSHPAVPCIIKPKGDLLMVEPVLPLRAVADGQMCVFYQGNECLGGGEVERTVSTL